MPLTKEDLAQFSGSETMYRHGLTNKVYTEGVKYVADTAEAYWLVDKIAIMQMAAKIRAEGFQVWKLTVNNTVGRLTCEDGNGHKVYGETITYTDFPLAEIVIWYTNDTLLLPGEY